MQFPAIALIQEEHRALGAVLSTLGDAIDQASNARRTPDFEAVRAMLFYLDAMPARLHHAMEEDMLFPRIRHCCPPLRPVLDRLQAEHGRVEFAVKELGLALTAWQKGGEVRREAFEFSLRGYVEGYLGHMEVEENYVLPVAQDYLSETDWRELHVAFQNQRGMLDGSTVQAHRSLLSRILTTPHRRESPCQTSKSPS